MGRLVPADSGATFAAAVRVSSSSLWKIALKMLGDGSRTSPRWLRGLDMLNATRRSRHTGSIFA